ncbi:BlaI/MecI/CopY family transcriptional regulator [bacterium]|nr:BlaI/MecI/CopY family transcriptional regulator [bacterium]
MTGVAKDITEAELAILRVIWEQDSATVREITHQIYPNNSESDYATVKKLLARLEKKEFVSRDRSETAHRFTALVSRDDLLGIRLQGLADNLCDGSRTPLLLKLLNTKEVTAQQQHQLRQLINDISKASSESGNSKSNKRRN